MGLSEFYPEMKGWTPVEESAPPARPQIPTPEVQVTPYLRTVLPLPLQYAGDTIKQYNRPGLSSFRIAPLPPGGIPAINAASAGVAHSFISQQATNPTAVPVDDVEQVLINRQGGTSYTVKLSDRNTLVTFNNNAGGTIVLPMGASPNAGTYSFVQVKNISANGPPSPCVAVGNISNSQGNLMILMVTIDAGGLQIPSISDSNNNQWTKIAVAVDGGNIPTSYWYAYNISGGSNTITITGGATFCLAKVVEYAGFGTQDPLDTFSIHGSAVSTIVTGAPNCLIYCGIEFPTNSSPMAIANFTSRYSDLKFLVEDRLITGGGTSVTGDSVPTVSANGAVDFVGSFKTSPPPLNQGFPAGWYTWLENTGTGTFTVQSGSNIDGSPQTLSLTPNTGVMLVFNGTSWFTERGLTPALFYQTVQQAGTSKPQEPKLNFLAPITATDNVGALSTDVSVPVFVASGASHAIGLVPDPGAVAGTAKFLREDATWAGISAIGGVSTFTGNYTALGTDNGKLLSFSVGAPVSPAFVQFKTGSAGVQSSIVSPSITLTAGNFVVVELVIGNANEQIGSSMTDTLGNLYVRIPSSHSFNANTAGGCATECWYAQNVIGGTTIVTAQWAQAGGFSTIKVAEYSGIVKTTSPVDAVITSTGNSGLPAPSLVTTGEDDIVVAAFVTSVALTYSNMTSRNGATLDFADVEIIPNTTFTLSAAGASSNWTGNLVGFQAGPSGGNVLKLPATAPSTSWIIFVQNTGTNPLFISGNGRTIDGSSTNLPLFGGQGLAIFTDGTNYFTSRGMQASPVFVVRSLLTLQSAAIAATTAYAIPAYRAGMYRISYEASVTRAATTSSSLGGTNGFQVKFTNANGDTVVKTSNPTSPPVSAGNTTGTTISGDLLAYCGANTNLQYLFDYTSVGGTTMQYDLAVYVEYLGQ